MLPTGTSRCAGRRDLTPDTDICPRRADCERHRHLGDSENSRAVMWLCESEHFEAWIPRPCAGMRTRVSNRPHPLCRGDGKHQPCRRWQYGTPDGITPDFFDRDGTATCAQRVVHEVRVGDAAANCAPTR